MFTVGILTVSDKGSRGERLDESGATIREMVSSLGARVARYDIVPDDVEAISQKFVAWAEEGVQVILSTGGTGLAPRDVTPEATLKVVDRLVPGLAEAMRAASLEKTPLAVLSRGVAGLRGKSLIINLPGSPKAVRECLEVILLALPHAVETAWGQAAECASREDLPGHEAR